VYAFSMRLSTTQNNSFAGGAVVDIFVDKTDWFVDKWKTLCFFDP
jgi:hypothetical protein